MIPLQRDCFAVVVQNLGFDDSSYVILRRIRAISRFGFLFVLFSYVDCASTCSRNLVFRVKLSCRVNVVFDDGVNVFHLRFVVTATLVDQLPLRLRIMFLMMISINVVGSAGRSKPPFQLTPGCRLIFKFNNYCWPFAG